MIFVAITVHVVQKWWNKIELFPGLIWSKYGSADMKYVSIQHIDGDLETLLQIYHCHC